MTAATTTLADWLLERLAEDEAVARAATGDRWSWWNLEELDQGWTGQGPDLVVEPGEWRTCDYFCTWTEGDPEHRGQPGTPGHSHLHRERVIGSWGHDAWGLQIEDEDAAHIARHDPARVLREVAAKRAIVERASRSVVRGSSKRPSPFGHLSTSEGRYFDARGRDVTDEFQAWHAVDGEPADMDALRDLASVYADQPGFQESWL